MLIKEIIKQNLSSKTKARLNILLSKIKLLFFKKEIGKNSYIDPTVNVFGWSHVSIGKNTLIGEQSWLNVNGREEGFKHIKIGDNCYIGKRSLISPAKRIEISSYALIGDDCKLIGANHIFENPMIPYAFTGAEHIGNIKIGVNVWIATLVCVVGDISIGHGSIIGASSVVTKSIPPFSIAVGNPCKVIKRYNFSRKKWISISEWTGEHEKALPTEIEYLQQMKKYKLNVHEYKYAASHRFGDII